MNKKEVVWLGTSRRDVKELGEDVCDALGTDLLSVQYGVDPANVKHLKSGVSEIKLNENESTFRLMYIAKFEEAIYVLHAFTKKSTRGSETPKRDAEIIQSRYTEALMRHNEYQRLEKEERQKK